jgi:hypothetical protein
MSIMKASLGRIVLVTGKYVTANGADTAPGIVTRVWSDDLVNVSAFPDIAGEVRRCTSIKIHPDADAAMAWVAEDPNRSVAAYWPPRV